MDLDFFFSFSLFFFYVQRMQNLMFLVMQHHSTTSLIDLGYVLAPLYKLLTSTIAWNIQCLWCVTEHLHHTWLCSLLMETSVKGRKVANFKMPAKKHWVFENRKVLFELAMKSIKKEQRIPFKETLCYFSDKKVYSVQEVRLKVPIARSELKKWSVVVLIPKLNIIQGGIQRQS